MRFPLSIFIVLAKVIKVKYFVAFHNNMTAVLHRIHLIKVMYNMGN